MNSLTKCSVYITNGPQDHHSKAAYGGDHITVAKCEKRNAKEVKQILKDVAKVNLKGEDLSLQWRPTKYNIEVWKGRYTMVIKSKRLVEVADQLKKAGISHLMGPGNGKCKFHVTLPKSISSREEAKEYAEKLAEKDWSLTFVDKTKGAEWHGYTHLNTKA